MLNLQVVKSSIAIRGSRKSKQLASYSGRIDWRHMNPNLAGGLGGHRQPARNRENGTKKRSSPPASGPITPFPLTSLVVHRKVLCMVYAFTAFYTSKQNISKHVGVFYWCCLNFRRFDLDGLLFRWENYLTCDNSSSISMSWYCAREAFIIVLKFPKESSDVRFKMLELDWRAHWHSVQANSHTDRHRRKCSLACLPPHI